MNLAFKLTSITALVLCACSSNSGDGANSGGASNTGGAGLTGGSSNGGGSAQGGVSNGGASNGGGSSGGVANGGASNGGGGVSNGGASNGGASNDKDGGADSGTNADGSAGSTPGACCAASTVPGCNDAAVQDCVCKQDPRCCSEKWNDVCVALVNGLSCGKKCPTNDCCTASTSGGCSDTTVQDCVCAKSAVCCQSAWDDVCVLLVSKNVLGGTCGTCN